jgi:hypothetical protein
MLSKTTLNQTLKLLQLLQMFPPTYGELIESDEAIELSGIDEWCVNEGRADKSDTLESWQLRNCIEEIKAEIEAMENPEDVLTRIVCANTWQGGLGDGLGG